MVPPVHRTKPPISKGLAVRYRLQYMVARMTLGSGEQAMMAHSGSCPADVLCTHHWLLLGAVEHPRAGSFRSGAGACI